MKRWRDAGERLKGSNVAQAVFDRESLDPNIDPIVRMEAARVRDRLREYYETDGRDDPIRPSRCQRAPTRRTSSSGRRQRLILAQLARLPSSS